jgi:hypothetical protein
MIGASVFALSRKSGVVSAWRGPVYSALSMYAAAHVTSFGVLIIVGPNLLTSALMAATPLLNIVAAAAHTLVDTHRMSEPHRRSSEGRLWYAVTSCVAFTVLLFAFQDVILMCVGGGGVEAVEETVGAMAATTSAPIASPALQQ